MKFVDIHIKGTAPYSQSRIHGAPKLDKERADEYENRTWREKSHYDAEGQIYIPAMALKFALASAAKKLSLQIPGKGKATFTKYFEADVVCTGDVPIGANKDTVQPITIQAHATGVRTDGKRVPRIFPMVYEWGGVASFVIMDDTVTREVFEEVARAAGLGIGIGRFRPQNGGLNGRFECLSFDWK